MGLFIQTSDFVGRFAIAQNRFTNIDFYINRYEDNYLKMLLGSALYALFKADLDPVTHLPVSPIYQVIFDAFIIQDNPFGIQESESFCRLIDHESKGMKDMLLGFVYFFYIRDQKYQNTVSGTVVAQPENSTAPALDQTALYGRYNDAIESYQAIRWYILKHRIDYPTFTGVNKIGAHWSI